MEIQKRRKIPTALRQESERHDKYYWLAEGEQMYDLSRRAFKTKKQIRATQPLSRVENSFSLRPMSEEQGLEIIKNDNTRFLAASGQLSEPSLSSPPVSNQVKTEQLSL